MAIGTKRIEDFVPVVKYNEGLYTELDVTVATGATVTLPSTTTIGGQAVVALGNITSSSTSATAFSVTNTGIFTGASVVAITANSATTGTIVLETANGLTTGHLHTLTSSATIVTTGDMLSITANTATTSTGLFRMSATGLTDGFLMALTGGGANVTASGGGINLSLGAATVGTGIGITTTGVYTGSTGMLAITANSATTGTLSVITANGLTTGTALSITSSSASTGTRSMVVISNSGTASVGTTPLFITNNAVTGTGSKFVKVLSGSQTSKTVTIWFSIDATTPNAALTGTAGDICLNGPSSRMFYCTGTTNWTASNA